MTLKPACRPRRTSSTTSASVNRFIARRWRMRTRYHDWRIYADFAHRLIVRARRLYAGDSLGADLKEAVYALNFDHDRPLPVGVPLGRRCCTDRLAGAVSRIG